MSGSRTPMGTLKAIAIGLLVLTIPALLLIQSLVAYDHHQLSREIRELEELQATLFDLNKQRIADLEGLSRPDEIRAWAAEQGYTLPEQEQIVRVLMKRRGEDG